MPGTRFSVVRQAARDLLHRDLLEGSDIENPTGLTIRERSSGLIKIQDHLLIEENKLTWIENQSGNMTRIFEGNVLEKICIHFPENLFSTIKVDADEECLKVTSEVQKEDPEKKMDAWYILDHLDGSKEYVQLSGLRFDDGTIDFWLVDKNGFHSEDLTLPIDIHRPLETKGKEVAIDIKNDAAANFLKKQGFILEEPALRYGFHDSFYDIYTLTEAGQYQASLLDRGLDKNIHNFYFMVDKISDQMILDKENVLYAPTLRELHENEKKLGSLQKYVSAYHFIQSGKCYMDHDLDHDTRLSDLYIDQKVLEVEEEEFEKMGFNPESGPEETKAKSPKKNEFQLKIEIDIDSGFEEEH